MSRKSAGSILRSRLFRYTAGVVGSLLLVYFIVDGILLPLYTRQGSEQPVPQLVGLSGEQARGVAASVGFEIVEMSPKLSSSQEAGTVLEQRPAAGALSKPGRKIYVVPAMPMERGAVPDVTGLDSRDAQLRCKNAGLVSGPSDLHYRFSERVPKGSVVSQDPPAGKKVDPGAVVKLTVSMGPQPAQFFVPYLMEKNISEAKTMLRESGLRLGKVVRKPTSQYPSGMVIAQSPASGTEVESNGLIDIVVAVRAEADSTGAPTPGSE